MAGVAGDDESAGEVAVLSATSRSTKAPTMSSCVLLPLALRYHPSISSSQHQSLTPPWLITIASIDSRKSRYGFWDSTDMAVAPPNAACLLMIVVVASLMMIGLQDALKEDASSGSKRRRPERTARMTASASAASDDAAEKLSMEAKELGEKHELMVL